MNCKRLFSIAALMSAAITALTVLSCQKAQEEVVSPEIMLVLDSENETGYDASLINPIGGYISFIQLDDNGRIAYMDFLHKDGQSKLTASFYENGLVKSIGGEDYAIVFSNYSGNKVDIAVICGEDIQMFKEYEGNFDWDHLGMPQTKAGMGTRAWWEPVNDYLYDYSTNHEALYFAGSQAIDIVTFAVDGAMYGKVGITNWLSDIVIGGTDLIMDNESTTLKVLDMGDVAVAAVSLGPWGALYSLVSNYSSYVDLCEEAFLAFFKWRDGRYGANVELGQAALNSGTGNLKITLSWNFYADIDVAVYEPSGNLINWLSPYSRSTGGFLDVDNREGGYGATENIYWENPVEGTYQVYLDYYGPSDLNKMAQSGMCKVTIMYKGIGKVYDVPMTEGDTKLITEIILPQGLYTRAGTASASNKGMQVNPKMLETSGAKPVKN